LPSSFDSHGKWHELYFGSWWCGRRVKNPTTGEAISGGGSDDILLGSSPSPALKTLAERSITRRFLSTLATIVIQQKAKNLQRQMDSKRNLNPASPSNYWPHYWIQFPARFWQLLCSKVLSRRQTGPVEELSPCMISIYRDSASGKIACSCAPVPSGWIYFSSIYIHNLNFPTIFQFPLSCSNKNLVPPPSSFICAVCVDFHFVFTVAAGPGCASPLWGPQLYFCALKENWKELIMQWLLHSSQNWW